MPPDRRAQVLIVDDDPNKRLALEAALAPLNQQLVTAESGRDALRLLLRDDFAVILLDVRMSDMDGFDTAALIRQRKRSEHTPIIFVTAFGQAEADIQRGYALGAVDFVFSPITPEILRNKVSVFVDLHLTSEEVRRQSERLRRLEALEHRRRLELAESRRRQAEARFETMLDIAADAILAVDEDRRIVLFNKAAERTFERDAESTIGARLDELITHGLERIFPSDGDDIPPTGQHGELRGRRAGGAEFPAEVSIARAPDGQGQVYTVILRDITERRETEEQVRRLNAALDQRLRAGIDMVADMAATLEPSEVLGRLLRRASAAVGADVGTLLRIDTARLVVEESHDLRETRPFVAQKDLDEQPLLVRAVNDRIPIVATPFDPASLPALSSTWGQLPQHVAVMPVVVAETVTAVLVVGRVRDEPFSTDDRDMLQLIGNVAVVALRNAELFSQAQESSRSKSEFLNLAAHELRTPLSVVRGYASMLTDGTLGAPPNRWERPLTVLEEKLRELNDLVDDLLTAARTEAGRVSTEPVVLDLRDAVRSCVNRAAARAHLLGAELCLDVPSKAVVARADPAHLARILDNLVNNALTYTSAVPWVRIAVGEDATIRVEDRGAGIPPDLHERVFERFFRVNDQALGPRPGTGLGLYISRALAEQQGGRLTVEGSEIGGGSTFRLSLPQVSQRELRRGGVRLLTPRGDLSQTVIA